MKRSKLKTTLEEIEKQAGAISDPLSIKLISTLLGIVESLFEETESKRKEIQSLNNEINNLKGEQGKPTVRKQTKSNSDNGEAGENSGNGDHSSENDRKKRAPKKPKKPRSSKKDKMVIDETIRLTIEPEDIPPGFYRNGTETTRKQDIVFTTYNTEFVRDSIYNPYTKEYRLAPLPEGYDGDYGPKLKALVKTAYSDWEMTTKNIATMLQSADASIEQSTVIRLLHKRNGPLHDEKEAIVKAGLLSTDYQHIDDTNARVRGKNRVVTIFANPYFTAYSTVERKNRRTVIDLLYIDGLMFTLNVESIALMDTMGLSQCYQNAAKDYIFDTDLTYDEMLLILAKIFVKKEITKQRNIILDACAIVSYQNNPYAVSMLIADDAPQFKGITKALGLCWIHEGRHYKKMRPIVPKHEKALENFRSQYWDFYYELIEFKKEPCETLATTLSNKFETIFSQTTGYETLDHQIELSYAKKEELLLVLTFPFIPLHNNSAELGARKEARGRDIHLHTMTEEGTDVKDTLRTIGETGKKLSVNLLQYFHDRISGKYFMPSLAELIVQRSGRTVPLH